MRRLQVGHAVGTHSKPAERRPVQRRPGYRPQRKGRGRPLPLAVPERDETDPETGRHPAEQVAELSDLGLECGDLARHAARDVQRDHQIHMRQLVGRGTRGRAGRGVGTRARGRNGGAHGAGRGLRLGCRCGGRNRDGGRLGRGRGRTGCGARDRCRQRGEARTHRADDRFRRRYFREQRDRLRRVRPRRVGDEGKDDDRNQDECAEGGREQVRDAMPKSVSSRFRRFMSSRLNHKETPPWGLGPNSPGEVFCHEHDRDRRHAKMEI